MSLLANRVPIVPLCNLNQYYKTCKLKTGKYVKKILKKTNIEIAAVPTPEVESFPVCISNRYYPVAKSKRREREERGRGGGEKEEEKRRRRRGSLLSPLGVYVCTLKNCF